MTPPAPPDAAPPAATPAAVSPLRSAGSLVRRVVTLGLAVLAGAALVGTGLRTALGVRETTAWVDRAAALQAEGTAFRAVPLLTDDELALLRRSLNARHVALGESLGVAPADSLGGPAHGLVRVDTVAFAVVLDGTHSDPLLTPDAARALKRVAAAFRDRLSRAGLPPYRIVATSLFRSAASQAALRRVNTNAAAGRSSHEFGTTFDLSYRRFEPELAAVYVSPRVPEFLRETVAWRSRARLVAAHARLAATYPARLDALLGRALIGLEDDGALVALRERNQTVYHVTAARRAAPVGHE